MNYPGENKMTLTEEAIMDLVGQSLNANQAPHLKTIRVLSAKTSGYNGDVVFVITTDKPDLAINPTEFNTTQTKEI